MAEFIKLYEENPNPRDIQKVVTVLKRGGLIIYPIDTVYGLICDITNIKALERIARIEDKRTRTIRTFRILKHQEKIKQSL